MKDKSPFVLDFDFGQIFRNINSAVCFGLGSLMSKESSHFNCSFSDLVISKWRDNLNCFTGRNRFVSYLGINRINIYSNIL